MNKHDFIQHYMINAQIFFLYFLFDYIEFFSRPILHKNIQKYFLFTGTGHDMKKHCELSLMQTQSQRQCTYLQKICVVQLLSHVQLFSEPIDCSPPGSSLLGISQQGYWDGLPLFYPGDLPNLGIEPASPALAGVFFVTEHPGKTENLILNK